MIGRHHQLSGHEFEQGPEVGDGLGSLACCSPWDLKESDMTETKLSNQQRKKEINECKMEKKSKLSLLADNMILYIENPKDSTRKLLELIIQFSTAAGLKLMQINLFLYTLALLYTNSEDQKEILRKQFYLLLHQKE